ncbi:hypothetical protein [Streptomyces sp. R33]|uniref:FCD domain-containing protein n=1 Tax=Streptomyces sp. R33 TaxID=3238629 RepID=A0AB39YIH5_9ACTN
MVDARLLALDEVTHKWVTAHFTGTGYRLRALSDTVFTGVHELATAEGEAAREELRGHLGSVNDILAMSARD